MTCVVGVTGKSGVLLAADAMLSDLHRSQNLKAPKVVSISETLAVGYCGSLRLGNLLTYYLAEEIDNPPLGVDELRWATRTLIPELRNIVIEHGVMRVHHNVELLDNAAFLLAIRGRLFTVQEDFAVAEITSLFAAEGSGGDVACGAMDAAIKKMKPPLTPSRQMSVALAGVRAASDHTPFVGGQISSVHTVRHTAGEREIAKRIISNK